MSRFPSLFLAAAVAFAAVAPAFAAPDVSVRHACRDDVHKFCSASHGMSAIVSCMKQHSADVSDQCRAAWKAHQKPEANATDPASDQ